MDERLQKLHELRDEANINLAAVNDLIDKIGPDPDLVEITASYEKFIAMVDHLDTHSAASE
jgi:hypothetical protein